MIRAALLVLLAGPVAAQELDCANPTTQVEMTGCADRAYRAADADLNAAYGEAMDRATRLDAGDQVAAVPNATLLRDAQRAWLPFRDAACSAEAGTWGNGSGASMAFLLCAERLTTDRTRDLRLYAAEN